MQLPGNEGIKRFFKPKRKPAEKQKPPQHEGEDADDEALDADETEPMWGDEALARIDGNDQDPVNNDEDQEPDGGSDDPAMKESGGDEQNPVQDYWERRGKYIYRVHVVPRRRALRRLCARMNRRYHSKTLKCTVPQCLMNSIKFHQWRTLGSATKKIIRCSK